MPDDFTEVKKKNYDEGCIALSDDYPYGTSLRFEDEMIDDLGVSALSPGDFVEVRAIAKVTSKSECESEDEKRGHKSMELQLTQVKINRSVDEDKVKTLYGG